MHCLECQTQVMMNYVSHLKCGNVAALALAAPERHLEVKKKKTLE